MRAGAQLSDADKTTLRALNQEESKLTTDFRNKLLAATKAGALVVDDSAQLDGFSDGEIAAAAEAAKQRGLAGKWVHSAAEHDAAAGAGVAEESRGARAALHRVDHARRARRCERHARDRQAPRAAPRARRRSCWASRTTPRMRSTTRWRRRRTNAIKLLTDLVPAATAKARCEAAQMQALIDKQKGGFKLAPWDWQYYAEQVRKAQYDLDESQLKPYFELDRVLQDGVFFAANQLYGLTFKERKDIPVYQPDVRVFEVFDADGKSLALFYARLLQARQQERRRVDGHLRRPVRTDRNEAGGLQRRQLHASPRRASRRC